MLDVFFERQLIDKATYGNLYNRSTPDDVTMALRSQIGIQLEAERLAAEEQQRLATELQAKEEAEKLRIEDREAQMHDDNVDLELSRQDNDLTKTLASKMAQ